MKYMKSEKYKNKKTLVDGIMFSSAKEAKRYLELKTKEGNDEIQDLKTQVPFLLQESFKINGKTIRKIEYVADFTYIENGELIVEDVKASKFFQTDIFKLKKKLFAYKYKKEIKEIY